MQLKKSINFVTITLLNYKNKKSKIVYMRAV